MKNIYAMPRLRTFSIVLPSPMILIHAQTFISGIFTDSLQALRYLQGIDAAMFENKGWVCKVEVRELHYPFYLMEFKDFGGTAFLAYQTEAEALDLTAIMGGVTLYTIDRDYEPPTPWTDYMESLPHRHLGP